MSGGNSGADEILEWDATNEEWKEMGKMRQSRFNHGMAVVNIADVTDYCTYLNFTLYCT